MKTRNDFAFEFQKQLSPMVAENILTSQAAHMMTQIVADLLANYASSIQDQIQERYSEWEEKFGENDQTFYTLGLRHAGDIVTEDDPMLRARKLADEYQKEIDGDLDEKE
jgi:hypothetical protein